MKMRLGNQYQKHYSATFPRGPGTLCETGPAFGPKLQLSSRCSPCSGVRTRQRTVRPEVAGLKHRLWIASFTNQGGNSTILIWMTFLVVCKYWKRSWPLLSASWLASEGLKEGFVDGFISLCSKAEINNHQSADGWQRNVVSSPESCLSNVAVLF